MARSKQDREDPTRSVRLMNNYTKAVQNIIKALSDHTVEYIKAHKVSQLEAVPAVTTSMLPKIPKGGILNLDDLRQFFTDAANAAIAGQSNYIGNSIERSYMQGVTFGGLHLKSIGITTSVGKTQVDQRIIDNLVSRNLSGIKGITEATGTSIISSLSDGLLNGEGIDKLTVRVIDQSNEIGWRRAEALARTETMRAVSHGTLNRYEDAGVKYVKFLSAGEDGRTCDECLSLNGKVYTLEESYGIIPVHVNCRCCWTPIVGAK